MISENLIQVVGISFMTFCLGLTLGYHYCIKKCVKTRKEVTE